MKGSPRKEISLWTKSIYCYNEKRKNNLKIRTVSLISFLCMSLSLSYPSILLSYNPEDVEAEFLVVCNNTWKDVEKCSWTERWDTFYEKLSQPFNHRGWSFSTQFDNFLFLYWPIRKSNEPHLPWNDEELTIISVVGSSKITSAPWIL